MLALIACSVAASTVDLSLAGLRGMPHWMIKNVGSNVVKGLFDVSLSYLYT